MPTKKTVTGLEAKRVSRHGKWRNTHCRTLFSLPRPPMVALAMAVCAFFSFLRVESTDSGMGDTALVSSPCCFAYIGDGKEGGRVPFFFRGRVFFWWEFLYKTNASYLVNGDEHPRQRGHGRCFDWGKRSAALGVERLKQTSGPPNPRLRTYKARSENEMVEEQEPPCPGLDDGLLGAGQVYSSRASVLTGHGNT